MAIFLDYLNDRLGSRLVIEDDDRTCYAYLIVDGEIVSDVWLYNVGAVPDSAEWSEPRSAPFANPYQMTVGEDFEPLVSSSEVEIVWPDQDFAAAKVEVVLRGQRHALLKPGAKPGWCRLASKPSPLAIPLDTRL